MRQIAGSSLPELLRELQRVNANLERLVALVERLARGLGHDVNIQSVEETRVLDADVLISLPAHLRRTAEAVSMLGHATASQLSSRTGRARAVESDYLNQLVAMGHLRRRRVGREIMFYAEA